jgi:hypothetical protein
MRRMIEQCGERVEEMVIRTTATLCITPMRRAWRADGGRLPNASRDWMSLAASRADVPSRRALSRATPSTAVPWTPPIWALAPTTWLLRPARLRPLWCFENVRTEISPSDDGCVNQAGVHRPPEHGKPVRETWRARAPRRRGIGSGDDDKGNEKRQPVRICPIKSQGQRLAQDGNADGSSAGSAEGAPGEGCLGSGTPRGSW